jgi:hypothetical protein
METEVKNAVIKSATISNEDGFLNCCLDLDYGTLGQCFSGYVLYLPKSYRSHELKSVAGHHIHRCMEIAGVSRFHELKGRTIRVCIVDGLIEAIGHIINDDWYCPRIDFKNI